jgi:hypothetical protein
MGKGDDTGMSERSVAASTDTLQSDWEWIMKVLRMSNDRVLDGQRITLYRPKGWGKSADIKTTMEHALIQQIKTIISTAEVVDAD